MQTRRRSLIEQLSSTAAGFIISLLAWEFIVKTLWGLNTNFSSNLGITLFFTVLSVARGYVTRRLFNAIDNNNKNKKVYAHDTTDRNHGTRPPRQG